MIITGENGSKDAFKFTDRLTKKISEEIKQMKFRVKITYSCYSTLPVELMDGRSNRATGDFIRSF